MKRVRDVADPEFRAGELFWVPRSDGSFQKSSEDERRQRHVLGYGAPRSTSTPGMSVLALRQSIQT